MTRWALWLSVVAWVAFLALVATRVIAAPLPPSAQFAFIVASNATGKPDGCTSVETAMVPNVEAGFAGVSSRPGEPECFYWLARRYAPSNEFPAACKIFISMLTGHMPKRLPYVCIEYELFLLNHPHYLERRFG